jgi:hypothetical protein
MNNSIIDILAELGIFGTINTIETVINVAADAVARPISKFIIKKIDGHKKDKKVKQNGECN